MTDSDAEKKKENENLIPELIGKLEELETVCTTLEGQYKEIKKLKNREKKLKKRKAKLTREKLAMAPFAADMAEIMKEEPDKPLAGYWNLPHHAALKEHLRENGFTPQDWEHMEDVRRVRERHGIRDSTRPRTWAKLEEDKKHFASLCQDPDFVRENQRMIHLWGKLTECAEKNPIMLGLEGPRGGEKKKKKRKRGKKKKKGITRTVEVDDDEDKEAYAGVSA